jgi:hypothetical protein
MARPSYDQPPRHVKPSLPAGAYACLQWLAKMGRYGNNPTEVARYLLLREIDELTRLRVLPMEMLTPSDESPTDDLPQE